MERLSEHGYVPMDHRELRFSFKQPREILDPDLAIASSQIGRGDRQVLNEAKKYENENRRVWFFVTFPATTPEGKVSKMVKVDLLIATAQGAMLIKVLDWPGSCSTLPGDKWVEVKSDGKKVEHPNQLAELDETTQWVRAYLESKGVCPATISSYILFTSPHVKPNFTSDPRIVVGPAACGALVSGNGRDNELAELKSYTDLGKRAISAVVSKIRRPSEAGEGGTPATVPPNEVENNKWRRLQVCLDAIPQFDLLFLRKNGCYIFGRLEKVQDGAGEKRGYSSMMEKFFTRTSVKQFKFEHSVSGLIGAPIAFVTGGLGLEPMCRVRLSFVGPSESSRASPGVISSIDVSPATRLLFRPFGCEGLVSAELNDIDALELARVPRSLNGADEAVGTDIVDQFGQVLGSVLQKSIQVGVKSMLPSPVASVLFQ